MNNLPTEIAHHIFSLLPRSSVYSCLFVNQLWHGCSQVFFYEKVSVQSPGQLCVLLATLTKKNKVNGGLGAYITWLEIETNRCDYPISQLTMLSKLLLLCPNIQRIRIENYTAPMNRKQFIPVDLAVSFASCTKLRRLECIGKEVEDFFKCGAFHDINLSIQSSNTNICC